MTALFIGSLILGLLVGVRVMLLGIERPRDAHPDGERSFRLSPAVIVAFLVVFGIAGYALDRRAGAGPASLIAVVLAALGAILTARVVTRWWGVVPEHDVDDERYVLQGQLGRVVTSIGSGGVGEVEFELDARRRVVSARGVAGESLPAGTEVVIERMENDVAYVEAWSQVEGRL